MFVVKQIVWAKTKGYPWWPAEINKLPNADHNYFKVTFVGQTNHALLQQKAIRKYLENYDTLKANNYKGLQNSIEMANNQLQKRKIIVSQSQSKTKTLKTTSQKSKRIKKSSKNQRKKLKSKENFLKEIKPLNDHLKSFQEEQKEQKIEKKPAEQSSPQRNSTGKEGQLKSDIESVDISQGDQSSQMQLNELEYLRNIDRKKIERTQEQLYSFITRFNSNIYDKEKECLLLIERIQNDQFKSEELLQSKITNMITYIHKKLSQRIGTTLKKDEIDRIHKINHCLKERVVKYLFDPCYYDQYLKRMEKNVISTNEKKQQKEKKLPRTYMKKHRKYKRRVYPQRKIPTK